MNPRTEGFSGDSKGDILHKNPIKIK